MSVIPGKQQSAVSATVARRRNLRRSVAATPSGRLDEILQPRQPLPRAGTDHLHSAGRAAHVRHAGKLDADPAGDRRGDGGRGASGRLIVGKFPHLASAYISGISVGILIRSPHFWPYALCAALSITSKYVLRWKNRHLWNPSNFGVSAMLFLYPAAVASLSIQWGNFLWPMIVVWCLGSIIVGV